MTLQSKYTVSKGPWTFHFPIGTLIEDYIFIPKEMDVGLPEQYLNSKLIIGHTEQGEYIIKEISPQGKMTQQTMPIKRLHHFIKNSAKHRGTAGHVKIYYPGEKEGTKISKSSAFSRWRQAGFKGRNPNNMEPSLLLQRVLHEIVYIRNNPSNKKIDT